MSGSATSLTSTPLPIIAHVSRVAIRVSDLVTGDRSDYPLLVSFACARALGFFGIESHVLYGHAAWVEVLENHSVAWVQNEYGETIDLTAGIAFKRKTRKTPLSKAVLSPPNLWSHEIPQFYRFHPEGSAELGLSGERDKRWWDRMCKEIEKNCDGRTLEMLEKSPPDFANEPMICPGRKLLDDSEGSFRHFDKIVSATGLPRPPF